jgi:hypothetical protein
MGGRRKRGATRLVRNLRSGRVQRLLCGVTGASVLPLAFEIYLEHYKGSFSDKWEWAPLALTPPVAVAGVAGMYSERAARTWVPLTSAAYAACGLVGTYFHARGVARKPGGFSEPTYNLVMGPPLLAPGSLALVGALGVAAGVVRRES